MIRALLASVLLSVLLPLQSFAQELSQPPLVPAPEEAPVPGVEEERPQGEIIPREWLLEERQRTPGYLMFEFLGGVLGGTVGGVPGIGLSLLATLGCEDCDNAGTSIALGVVGVAGLLSGSALGVRMVGGLTGGEGRYLATLGGAVLGALGGIAVAVALGVLVEEVLAIPPLIAGPFVGAVIGYEFSDSSERERKAASSPGVAVLPSVRVHPSGGLVAGLVGRF